MKQAEEIAKREAASAEKKEATIVKAQNDIDNFYKEYNAKKAKNIAKNKSVLSFHLPLFDHSSTLTDSDSPR